MVQLLEQWAHQKGTLALKWLVLEPQIKNTDLEMCIIQYVPFNVEHISTMLVISVFSFPSRVISNFMVMLKFLKACVTCLKCPKPKVSLTCLLQKQTVN